jgi:hypothetical protein
MKGIENIQADILNKKPKYKEKQKTKDLFIFRKDRNNIILNKQQLASIIYIDSNLFID